MDRDAHLRAVNEVLCDGSRLRDGHRASQHTTGHGRAQRQNDARPHQRAFDIEPLAAGFDLAGIVALVEPPLAVPLVFKMLDRIGDIDVTAPNAGFGQRPIEDPAARTDESFPARSSRSPGCSPTSINATLTSPSPGTTCVVSR
jgi:hypothetical protein